MEELKKIREQILADVVPLVIDSESGPDQFDLILRIIQAGNANGEVYKKAYQSALKIEDRNRKLEALLALMDEIDFDLQSSERQTQDTPEVERPAWQASDDRTGSEGHLPVQNNNEQL